MDLKEIEERFKEPDSNKEMLLEQINELKEKHFNGFSGPSLSEIEALENIIKTDMTRFDNNPDKDHTPVMPDGVLPDYKRDNDNMRYVDEKTGNTVQYSVGNKGHSYGLKTRDKNGEYREPTKKEIEALADISGFKKVSISTGFSPETLALMKEVCKEKGITILNMDKIDEKIRLNEENKAKENKSSKEDEQSKKDKPQEKLLQNERKLQEALNKINKIKDPKKREAARRKVLALYSHRREELINTNNENNKKRNNSNTNQQGRLPQIPTPRDR